MSTSSFCRHLPTIATLGNLLCGLGAIGGATGMLPAVGLRGAAGLIGVAMLLDAIDGLAARAAGAVSRFGVQLDSLADIVSFGAAPSVLMVTSSGGSGGWPRGIVLAAAAGYACCTAVRLARYGAQEGPRADGDPDGAHFEGLPSPAAAALVGGLTLCEPLRTLPGASALVGALAGTLMVCPASYPHAGKWLATRKPKATIIAVVAAALVAYKPACGPFALSVTYAALPLLKFATRQMVGRK